MKHCIAAFLAAFLALPAAALAADRPPDPAREGWKLAFHDNFDRAELGTDWLVIRGDWRIENGRLKITRPWSSDSAIRTMQPLRENVRLEFDLSVPGPFYVKAAVRIGDQFWDGGGRMRAGRGARGGENAGELAIQPPGSKEQGDFNDLTAGRTYHVVLQYEDGRLRGWVDGKLVKDEQETLDGRYNDYAALFAIKDAEFDNVRLFAKPHAPDFTGKPVSIIETNRRATVDAAKFLDPKKPDCGFQEAIDSLPATGGAVILPKGEFTLHTALFLRDGVAIRGQGRDTVLALPKPLVRTTLTAPAKAGDTVLRVQNAAAFQPGWMLCLGNDSAMYYLRNDEPWRVAKVEDGSIHLNRPLAGALAKGAAVGNWFPVIYGGNGADMEVRDLAIEGRVDDPAPYNGGYGASAITFFFVRDSRVAGVHVNGWKGDAFSFQGGRNNLCADCSVVGATGHGYHPGSCQRRTIIARCTAERCGGDGYYFCRYNEQSVIADNRFDDNKGCMIGGLASAGDAFNAITLNTGRGNRLGIPIWHGANDVISGNRITDSGEGTIIELTGGPYTGLPQSYHVYAGPARYHVIAGNTFVDGRKEASLYLARDTEGAAANLVAFNTYQFASPPPEGGVIAVKGPGSVVVGNTVRAPVGRVPDPADQPRPAPVPIPEPAYAAIKDYDPAAPDCGFQKAIDAVSALGGGAVRLPAGEYLLKQSLKLASNVTLCGEGLATTLVVAAGPAVHAKGAENVSVRRLSVRGPGRDLQISALGVEFEEVSQSLIEGVLVEDMPDRGIAARNSDSVIVTQCKVRRCGVGYDFVRAEALSLIESFALECHTGARVVKCDGPLVHANILWRNDAGLLLEGLTLNPALVHGNVVSNSARDGVAIQGCIGVLVSANVIHDSSISGRGKFAGVLIAGASGGVRVVMNRIGDDRFNPFQTVAVRETEKSNGTLVQANVLCPNNWPPDGKLDTLTQLIGKDSVAKDNVLAPYPPAR